MSTYGEADWVPAPANKQGYSGYPSPQPKKGVVLHDMDGWQAGAYSRLMDANERASWQYSVYQDGIIEAHYDDQAVCWHCGNIIGNRDYIGIEHEGRAPDELTKAQYQATLGLVRYLFREHGWGAPERRVNLWEHRELSQTSCPSGRIPWDRLIADLQGGDVMTDEAEIRRVAEEHLFNVLSNPNAYPSTRDALNVYIERIARDSVVTGVSGTAGWQEAIAGLQNRIEGMCRAGLGDG